MLRLIDPLALAEEEGFVNKMNAKYVFCHDRIQEAAYSMTAEEESHIAMHYLAFLFSMSTMCYASKISDSVEMGCEILSKLGEELPRSYSDDNIELQIKTTQLMIDNISVMDLLAYRVMTDKTKIMAMKFLRRLKEVTEQVDPNLLPIVTLKMVEITLNYGMSPMSPVGFVYFGSLDANLGDIKGGYKFASLAKSIVDRMKLREIAGQVFYVSADLVCFTEPLHIANENRLENEALALAAGDVTCACYSRVMYASGAFWSGSKLSVSLELVTQGRRFLMSRGHDTSDDYLLLLQHAIIKLIGSAESKTMTDRDVKQRIFNRHNPHALEVYRFLKIYEAFILDDYNRMKESAIEFFQCAAKSWVLTPNHIFHVLTGGLVAFRIYRETNIAFWLEQGEQFKAQMQIWAEQGSSWTFENKCLLLEAEAHFSNDRIDLAQPLYDRAISSAKIHMLVHEEALAYELAANFFFNTSDFLTSLEYYTAAHEKYCQWGAYAKADSLYKSIQEKLTPFLGTLSAHPISIRNELQHPRCYSEGDHRKRKQR
ncbi:hypothetical protein HJC23_003682 [Cyclotella cryptica]|uniref:Uncharacterized protein n=1 Tax=Cyclotella cryptica TaxID=29204 RepID=A0ABD3P1E6_9STRA